LNRTEEQRELGKDGKRSRVNQKELERRERRGSYDS